MADFRENFEGPDTTWTFAAADAPYRVEDHRRVQQGAHWGQGCELLRVAAGTGTHVYFAHPTGNPRVHPELNPSVWVKADRPGVQLLARVVFPRAVDSATGQPVTGLIQGGAYKQPGTWQRLSLENIPERVSRLVRVLRLQLGRDIDEREAYLDLLLLNAYCGSGVVNLLIDDLEIDGHLPHGRVRAEPASRRIEQPAVRPSTAAVLQPADDDEQVELRGGVLVAGGQPLFPRAIEHHGESFELLKRLGFNTVRLAALPTLSQLDEARRTGMWLIAPPPDVQAGRSISSTYDRVIAWDLGGGLLGRDISAVRELAAAVRRADGQTARPMLVQADEQLRTYSRVGDVLLVSRDPLGGSLDLDQYGAWLDGRRQLLRPGTPIWATIQTEPLSALVAQWQVLGAAPPPPVEPEQTRMLAYAAIMGGARALVFRSRGRLDADDAATQTRALSLERINRELELIEAWLAVSTHPSPLRVEQPHVQAAKFPTQRSHLILISNIGPAAQYVAPPPRAGRMTLVVPGIPESSDAYFLSPTGLRPLSHRRVTGGVGINLDEIDWIAAVVFTSDPLVFARLTQTAAASRRRVAELRQQLAQSTLLRTQAVYEQLSASRRLPPDAKSRLMLAQTNVGQSGRMLAGGDAQAAYQFAQRAEQTLAGLRRQLWNELAATTSPGSHPALANFQTLPLATRPEGEAAAGTQSALPEGNMENLSGMLAAGWRHFRREQPGVQSHVELSTVDPRSGRYALRLEAASTAAAVAQLESPPVWIRSPAVRVMAGQRYVVRGWARVDSPLEGTADGLLVYDSAGGRDLAQRIAQTDRWQPFELHRAAPRSGPIDVNIELTGTGEAYVDDVEILVGER